MGELATEPPTSVVLLLMVSVNWTPVAVCAPVLVIVTVYISVPPGAVFALSTALVAVTVVVCSGEAGEVG